MLFSDRSIWTMVHGIVLGGGALLALAAALFALRAMRTAMPGPAAVSQARALAFLLAAAAILVWLTVLIGTYVNFPPYRATPPEGLADPSRFPRSMLLSNPATAWLHTFAMETKEHMPWMAGMLATGAAFVALRYRSRVLLDAVLNRTVTLLVAIAFGLVAAVSLLGVFVNKVAPLD